MYCDIYPALTEKGGGRFPQLFAEEFVRSYEQQIGEFKRLYPGEVPYPPGAAKADKTSSSPAGDKPGTDNAPDTTDAAPDAAGNDADASGDQGAS